MMAVSVVSASFNLFVHDSKASMATKTSAVAGRLPATSLLSKSSLDGCPLLIRTSFHQLHCARKVRSVSVRCEQSAKGGNGVDVWLGRLAMVGFASAISVEIGTGKGLLENFGVLTPLPTVALAVTALVGILTAVFIFQSASKN